MEILTATPQTVSTATPEQIQGLILGQPGTELRFWLSPPAEVTGGRAMQVDLMRGPTGGVGEVTSEDKDEVGALSRNADIFFGYGPNSDT